MYTGPDFSWKISDVTLALEQLASNSFLRFQNEIYPKFMIILTRKSRRNQLSMKPKQNNEPDALAKKQKI